MNKVQKGNHQKRLLGFVLAVVLLLVPLSAFGAVQGSGGNRTEIKKVSKINVSKKKLQVDVGLYIRNSPGSTLPEAQIKKQLNAVKKFADTIRFYGAAGELAKAYKIARKMKFKVIGSAWLSGDAKANEYEVEALIKACKKGYVDVACVGSETLFSNDLTPAQLVEYMNYVRNRISKKIPVTTADDAYAIIENPEVGNACDLLMVNSYPYLGGVAADKAAEAFDRTINEVRSAYPGKELIVSETGWPTAGGTCGDAVAGGKQARKYFDDVRKWSKKNNIVVLWFEAADEPWKANTKEGPIGSHWGLMTKNCKLKSCYKGAV